MRKFVAALCLLAAFTASASLDVTFNFVDITSKPVGVRSMRLYGYYVDSPPTNIVVNDRRQVTTSSAGSVLVTNLIAGTYWTELYGPFGVVTNWFDFTGANGPVNARDYIKNSAIFAGSIIPAYSTTQADAKFTTPAQVTNIVKAVGTSSSGTGSTNMIDVGYAAEFRNIIVDTNATFGHIDAASGFVQNWTNQGQFIFGENLQSALTDAGSGFNGIGITNGAITATSINATLAGNGSGITNLIPSVDFPRSFGGPSGKIHYCWIVDDTGTDIDDEHALFVAIQLTKEGLLYLIGCVEGFNSYAWGSGVAECYTTYYGVPWVGHSMCATNPVTTADSVRTSHADTILANYSHTIIGTTNTAIAVDWMRRALSQMPSNSLTVIEGTTSRNLYDLWYSPPDVWSPLWGSNLLLRALDPERPILVAQGNFPYTTNASATAQATNWTDDPSRAWLFTNPIPVIFFGTEIGASIQCGWSITNRPTSDLLYGAWLTWLTNGAAGYYTTGREQWTTVPVLYAAYGSNFWGTNCISLVGGQIVMGWDGSHITNSWATNASGPQYFATLTKPAQWYRDGIERYFAMDMTKGQAQAAAGISVSAAALTNQDSRSISLTNVTIQPLGTLKTVGTNLVTGYQIINPPGGNTDNQSDPLYSVTPWKLYYPQSGGGVSVGGAAANEGWMDWFNNYGVAMLQVKESEIRFGGFSNMWLRFVVANTPMLNVTTNKVYAEFGVPFYGQIPSGGATNAAGSAVAYLSDVTGIAISGGTGTGNGFTNAWFYGPISTTNAPVTKTNNVVGAYAQFSSTNLVFSNSVSYTSLTNGRLFITNFGGATRNVEIDPATSISGTNGANYVKWDASDGTLKVKGAITANGGIVMPGAGLFYWSSYGLLSSSAAGVIALQNNAQNDFDRLQFGGTTASFPALKRNGTGLIVCAADGTFNSVNDLSVSGKIIVSNNIARTFTYQTANYTMGAGDRYVLLRGNLTATLPDAVTNYGKSYTIKCADSGTNAILTVSSQTIDGQTKWTNTAALKYTEVTSSGTNWFVTGQN